jgi:hypothetical protein
MKTPDQCPRAFYQYLRRRGISKSNLLAKLESWGPTDLLDFAKEAHLTLLSSPPRAQSVFTFSANATLSGAPFPCAGLDCRLRNLDSAARFAALYADRVYITNPFEPYVDLESAGDFMRRTLAGDIMGMLYVQPLLEEGILCVQNNIVGLCRDCLAEVEGLEREISKKVDRARRRLLERYLKEVKVQVMTRGDEAFLAFLGPENLLGHDRIDLVGDLPEAVLEDYVPGSQRRLTKKEIKANNLLGFLVNPVAMGLFQQSVRVRLYQTQYLTDSEVELDLVTSIDRPEVVQLSQALLAGLSHSLPTVEGVSLSKLVDLRREEGEAFQVYRDKLHAALKQSKGLNEFQIRQLVEDEISPEIHRIERTMKKARALLVKSLKTEMLIGAGYVAIGLCSGLLSRQAVEIVAAVGGYSFASSVAEKVMKLGGEPEEVLDSPYYFLWKVRRAPTRS